MATTTQSFHVRAHFVPFVTRVLYRGDRDRHQGQSWPIPVDHRDLYTADDLDAMRDVLSQGLLYAFCHRAQGWDKRAVLIGNEPHFAQPRELRLWQAAEHLEMRFGTQSMALCEGLYNAMARKPTSAEQHRKNARHTDRNEIARLIDLKLDGPGDAPLTYWMLCGLWRQLQATRERAAKKDARQTWGGLMTHFAQTQPLLQLRYGPWTVSGGLQEHDLEVLIRSPLRGLLPWWIRHALEHWQDQEAALWSLDTGAFVTARNHQTTLIERWIDAIDKTGWVHLAAPFQEHFAIQERWLTALSSHRNPAAVPSDAWRRVPADHIPNTDTVAQAARARIDTAYKDLRQQDRQLLRAAWASSVESVGPLAEAWRRRVRIHNADRESNDTFMVDWGTSSAIDALSQRLGAIARGIDGRLG